MNNEKVKRLANEYKSENQKLLDDLLVGSIVASMTDEEFTSIGERAIAEIKKHLHGHNQTTPKCASSENTNEANTSAPETIETTNAKDALFDDCSAPDFMDDNSECIDFNSERSSSESRSSVAGSGSKSSSNMKSTSGIRCRFSSSISSIAFFIAVTSLFISIATLIMRIAGA